MDSFPIKILAHRKSDSDKWQSNYEYHNYWSAEPQKGWLTSTFIDDLVQVFKPVLGEYSQYSVELDDYDNAKDGYYLMHYGVSYTVLENRGMGFLTPEIVDRCNQGSIKLLIAFVYETFDSGVSLKEWSKSFFLLLNRAGIIRADSVVILTSTASDDPNSTDHRCKFIYYPMFELRFQTIMKNKNFHPQRIVPQAGDFSKKNKHFINLNLAIRPHRFLMILYLMKLQVDRYGHISWLNPDDQSWKKILNDLEENRFGWQKKLDKFSPGEYGFFHFIKIVDVLRSIPLDHQRLNTNDFGAWLGASEFYHSAWVDLVSETHCELYGDVFLTEKTFKPMAYGLPFIFNASKNHLHQVKQLGYQTFPELFGERYDTMSSGMDKIAEIGTQISIFCRDPEKINLIKNSTEIQEKLKHNQDLFWNKNHADQLGKLLHDAWITGRA